MKIHHLEDQLSQSKNYFVRVQASDSLYTNTIETISQNDRRKRQRIRAFTACTALAMTITGSAFFIGHNPEKPVAIVNENLTPEQYQQIEEDIKDSISFLVSSIVIPKE
jgi:hypothetical protein